MFDLPFSGAARRVRVVWGMSYGATMELSQSIRLAHRTEKYYTLGSSIQIVKVKSGVYELGSA